MLSYYFFLLQEEDTAEDPEVSQMFYHCVAVEVATEADSYRSAFHPVALSLSVVFLLLTLGG